MPAKILAIETSTPTGSVALVSGDETLYHSSFGSKRSHNSELFAPLREALALAGDGLDLIVVGTGPGSYTGARIGIAAAQGIGMAKAVPVIGMCSLVALEVRVLPQRFKVCGDARRGLFYIATVQNGRLQGEITQQAAESFTRDREEDADGLWYTFDEKVPLELGGVTLSRPSATTLALQAGTLSEDEIKALAAELVQPVYLSAPFVTPAKVRVV